MSVYLVGPTSSSTPSGATAVTVSPSGTIHSVLAATGPINPAAGYNYVTYTGTHPSTESVRFVIGFTNPLGVDDVLGNIDIRYVQSSDFYLGWFYPIRMTGFDNDVPHVRHFGVPPFTRDPFNTGFHLDYETVWVTPASVQAADGTLWSACDRFEVEWALHAPQVGGAYQYGQSAINVARLNSVALSIEYVPLPVVGFFTGQPGPTVTTPRPTITWWTSQSPQSSYQVVIVPALATDSAGRGVSHPDFDPPSAAADGWDSGKVRSLSTTATSAVSLPEGSYKTFVRAWTSTPIGEVAGRWYTGTPVTFTIDVENVNPPALTISADTTFYTMQITVAPGTPTGGFNTPHNYEVQRLDPVTGWVAISTPDGLVSGNTTTLLYDSLQAPGVSFSYRARSRFTRADGLVVVTQWVVATATATNKGEWWLRCLNDRTLNRTLSSFTGLSVQDWKPTRERPQTVTWGIGARYATVTQDVVKSATIEMSVWAFTATARTDLLTLLNHDGDLALVSPWAELWRVRVGARVDENQHRVAPRSGETTPLGLVRSISFTLTEVG